MFQNLQNIFSFSFSLGDVFFNMTVALITGLLISFVYRLTYRGPNYSITFVNSLIILSMITAIVIMVIGNNLARAFGLVGAMSIIRFRTAVKDTQDIVFIFFALTVGMAAGVGLASIALSGTIFIGVILIILFKIDYSNPRRKEFLLQFISGETEKEASYLPIFKKYCKSQKLINLKSLGDGDKLELTFYVKLKEQTLSKHFLREMGHLPQIENVNMFLDEEQF